MTGGFLAYTAESKAVGPSPIVILTLQPFPGTLLYFFFFFSILPTSDKRGILAVTVITLFCVRRTTLGASSEQASLNCTVCTTASHHMMNTSRICLTGEQPVYTTVFHHRLKNSDRTLPTASPTSLKVSNDLVLWRQILPLLVHHFDTVH